MPMSDVSEEALWRLVLQWLFASRLAPEPSLRDRPLIDETFAELYVLGERQSAAEVRSLMKA